MTAKPAKSTSVPASPENLQGLVVDRSNLAALREAVELAFNYRGDVTLMAVDGKVIEGYIFDCRENLAADDVHIRMFPKDSDERVTIALSKVQSLHFTGKDTASGKSFESWIRKYAEKKLRGESANIESESLDE